MKSILFASNIFPAEQEAFKKTITTLNLLCCMQVMLCLSQSFHTIPYRWQAVILKN